MAGLDPAIHNHLGAEACGRRRSALASGAAVMDGRVKPADDGRGWNVRYEAECEVWLWTAEKAAWHFVTLPKDVADGIKALTAGPRRGWGSVRVTAAIGDTRWKTSIFPEKRSGSFLLPIKADVRAKENVVAGDTVLVAVELEM